MKRDDIWHYIGVWKGNCYQAIPINCEKDCEYYDECSEAYEQLKKIIKKHFADYVNTSTDRGKHWKEE